MILPVSGGMRKANKTKHINVSKRYTHVHGFSQVLWHSAQYLDSKFLKVLIKYPVLLCTKKQ